MDRRGTEFALRSVPVVFQGPAVTAIYFWPCPPLQATIGVGATAVVNRLLWKLIDDAGERLEAVGGWKRAEADRLRRTPFASWWICAMIVGVVLFDVLLTILDVLKDTALYALVLAFGANAYIIVFNSLRRNGAAVRGEVIRAVLLLRVLPSRPVVRRLRVHAPATLLAAQSLLVCAASAALSELRPDLPLAYVAAAAGTTMGAFGSSYACRTMAGTGPAFSQSRSSCSVRGFTHMLGDRDGHIRGVDALGRRSPCDGVTGVSARNGDHERTKPGPTGSTFGG